MNDRRRGYEFGRGLIAARVWWLLWGALAWLLFMAVLFCVHVVPQIVNPPPPLYETPKAAPPPAELPGQAPAIFPQKRGM